MRRIRAAVALVTVGLLLAALAPAAIARPGPGSPAERNAKTTEIQILGLNDFHGALAPPGGSGGRIGSQTETAPDVFECLAPTCFLAGGVEFLGTHVEQLRATNPNTLFVSAGDMIGASPLTSALFHDEPSIEAFNMMGLDYNGVGNHEFDEGIDELLRMQNGGCHPVDGCQDGDGFAGAEFQYLAANVVYKDTGETIFAPYAIHKFNGVKVAIVGMTLEGTSTIVTPSAVADVNFLDEAETVNALVPELKKQGAETIIVLLHEGGSVDAPSNGAGSVEAINDCDNPTGALPPIVEAMDDEIDVVVTGHTNWAVNCVIDGKVVTGAASNGRLVTDIDLTVSRATKDVIASETRVNNVIVTRDVTPNPALSALVDEYETLAAPLANAVVGQASADLLRENNAAGESSLGDIIADAQLAATSPPAFGGSVVAFMNPGGIRGDIFAGDVTYGELFTVQPFSNVMTVLTCTGTQIDALLEQQFYPDPDDDTVLQVSEGFAYTWDAAAPLGARVDIGSITIDGVPIDPAADYRVSMNNFLATGGDGFSVFTECVDPLGGEIDIDALVAYFEANSPIDPGLQDRITRLN
ncbi:MAG: bifunctional metallophosphatase/5'-nucleotidase [Candidatus Limnocylindria bacterium]